MPAERPDGGGLQRERTRLAWRRTALSFAAVGALLLRDGLRSGPVAVLSGSMVLVFAVVVYVMGAVRARRAMGGEPDRPVEPAALPAFALAALAVAAAALSLLVVLSR